MLVDRDGIFVRQCVQERQTCSIGGRPIGVKVRSPLAWVASVEKTKLMKPTDKASLGMVSESPGCNESEPRSGLERKFRTGSRVFCLRTKATWHGAG